MNKKEASKLKIQKKMLKKDILKSIKKGNKTKISFLVNQYKKKYGNL
tara:strand:- start:296 stop:436 length:141 start_codon:yes stop_codon:yes gene_type:complete